MTFLTLDEYNKSCKLVRLMYVGIKLDQLIFFFCHLNCIIFLKSNPYRIITQVNYVRHSMDTTRLRYYYHYNCFLNVKIEFIKFSVN